jgi:TatD DNase family protein
LSLPNDLVPQMKSNRFKYIDIHGHLDDQVYDADRDLVIERALSAGVAIITVGTNLQSSKKAVELAEKYENVWAAVGVHPTEHSHSSVNSDSAVKREDQSPDSIVKGEGQSLVHGGQAFDYGSFKKLATHPKVVAIGECGLDYFYENEIMANSASQPSFVNEKTAKIDPTSENGRVDLQRHLFLEHIRLANEVGKPLMLHMRKGANATSVYLEAVAILKEHAKVPANFHFFAGTIEDAKAILEIGGMFSFTGVITFARNYDEVIRYIPLDRIMSETDCPYVSPKPYRGKRNESVYVVEVVKAIANIRGEDEGVVATKVLDNAQKFFGKSLG